MRFVIVVTSIVLSLLCCINLTSANPGFFEKLFGLSSNGYGGRGYNNYGGGGYNSYSGYGGYGGGFQPQPQRPRPNRQPAGRSYKDICRVINADSYANPRAVPFPAQPFCPY